MRPESAAWVRDIMGMIGGAGGGDMMAMIPQLMRLANVACGHRRHKHR